MVANIEQIQGKTLYTLYAILLRCVINVLSWSLSVADIDINCTPTHNNIIGK